MIYRNTKTGAIIDSPCIVSGGDWVEEAVKPTETIKPIEEKPTKKRR